MAIVTEIYELNGRQFARTYSDAGRYIIGGEPYGEYAEANDPAEYGRIYTEGDVMPPEEWIVDPNAATAEDYEAALVELGVKL